MGGFERSLARRIQLLSIVQHALLDVLKEFRSTDTIRTFGTLAWDLRSTHQETGGDGETRIVLAAARPMSAAEVFNQPRRSITRSR